ncbi:MAG: molybdenum ABC transporter ATP-binding protein [Rhodobacteraceae bacterium]|nr:molybdenum ABC transporter ATP-binding protein [Paracoccaceae bacterium]
MGLSVDIRHDFGGPGGFSLDARFEAPPGVTALFGRSGSGKTTVVNAVAGLLAPREGRIALDGEVLFDTASGPRLAPHRRRLGYVFQEARLFPHLSLRANLAFGTWFAPGRAAPGEFDRVVEMLGIGPLLDRRPGALSGGEKQRAAIGRALLSRPRMLLMDEPLAALDEARKAEILPYLERLRDAAGVPILYVSHAMAEVARLATTVVAMEAGRVAPAGPAAEVLSDLEAAPALGLRDAGALLPGVVAAHHADGLTEVEVSGGRLLLPRMRAAPGTRLRIRIAAQEVILSRTRPEGLSALNILAGEVVGLRVGEGGGALVQLRVGEDLLLARITRRSAAALEIAPGAACWCVVKSVAVARTDVGRATG